MIRRSAVLVVFSSLLLGCAQPPAQEQAGVKKYFTEELKQLLDERQDLYVLDVRETKELEEIGTVKGYHHIPLGDLEKRLGEIPKDREVLTLCQRAARAGRAADLLQKNGYKVAGAAGLRGWKEKGYPVVYPTPVEGR